MKKIIALILVCALLLCGCFGKSYTCYRCGLTAEKDNQVKYNGEKRYYCDECYKYVQADIKYMTDLLTGSLSN